MPAPRGGRAGTATTVSPVGAASATASTELSASSEAGVGERRRPTEPDEDAVAAVLGDDVGSVVGGEARRLDVLVVLEPRHLVGGDASDVVEHRDRARATLEPVAGLERDDVGQEGRRRVGDHEPATVAHPRVEGPGGSAREVVAQEDGDVDVGLRGLVEDHHRVGELLEQQHEGPGAVGSCRIGVQRLLPIVADDQDRHEAGQHHGEHDEPAPGAHRRPPAAIRSPSRVAVRSFMSSTSPAPTTPWP